MVKERTLIITHTYTNRERERESTRLIDMLYTEIIYKPVLIYYQSGSRNSFTSTGLLFTTYFKSSTSYMDHGMDFFLSGMHPYFL